MGIVVFITLAWWVAILRNCYVEHVDNQRAQSEALAKRAAMNTESMICDYEAGLLNYAETVALFQHLVDTGIVGTLHGHYGRAATRLIQAGILAKREWHV